ncbi:MAG: HAD-IA family hydrolase [Pseudomonadota bacterium]|nr:HAD-IA family hydrolase [Pseudomonadota bacterium]
MRRDPGCVLLDLDGTLADTAADLIAAVNRLLQEEGRDILDASVLRGEVSRGSRSLLLRAFGVTPEAAEYAGLRQRFLDHYERCYADSTTLFEGVAQALAELIDAGFRWGIVTNKPSRFTFPLLEHLALDPAPECIITPDMVPRAKPDPAPVRLACAQLDVAPSRVLFAGDARQDIEAGRAAGVATAVALYGYIPDVEDPADWGADYSCSAVSDLPEVTRVWLGARQR